jgi:predicted ester cyclase
MATLTNDQILELQKMQKLLSMLEKISSSSKNDDQKKRVVKDIQKYKNKILAISPEGIPQNIQNFTVHNKLESKQNNASIDSTEDDSSLLSNIPVMKISPHSHDNEINYIGSLISFMENEFVTILSDSHTKFDFSHASERDALMKTLENLRRTIKVLTETVEEYALSEKQDFKEQLGRMKNKQSRIFISEAGEMFKAFRDFLFKVIDSIDTGVIVVMNLNEKLHFNPKFEQATVYEGKEVHFALRKFYEYTLAVIKSLNIPSLKK